MSLKLNVVANYASQLYVTVIGIALVPIYIERMGAEAYGLVGFFAMLQAWFSLLDLGLTPTISRETARYRSGVISAINFRQIFRALSIFFLAIATLGGGGLWASSSYISTHWLNKSELPSVDVQFAVEVMALSVALRWLGGLYRGVVSGSERLVFLSAFNAVIATLRYVGVLVSMSFFGFNVRVFFLHQIAVGFIEIAGLYSSSQRLLPSVRNLGQEIGWSFKPVYSLFKFSVTIAITSSIWVLVTQTDKLVLSGVLSLSEYGFFTLAVLVSSGITVLSGPVSGAIMPRMAALHAKGAHDDLIAVYRQSTQLVSVLAGSAATTIAICAEPLLFAWSGNSDLAVSTAPTLVLYALGNGFLSVSAFPYYLQYARGDLRYHLIGNLVMVAFLIPLIIFAAKNYGSVGAGFVWLGMNTVYFIGWIAYVHSKLLPGLHRLWLLKDCIGIFFPGMLFGYLASLIPVNQSSRFGALVYILIVGGTVIGSALVARVVIRKL